MSRSRQGSLALAALTSSALLLAGCTMGEEDAQPEEAEPEATASETAASEEVVIPAEGVDLNGTLYLPGGDEPSNAVVIVHGSGPHSRDGEMPGQLGLTLPEPVAVYRELAQGLQAQGYAVLTWDKRTCGGFNDCSDNDYPVPPQDLLFEDISADTGAALDFLTARADIGEVALIGHSKGGAYAASVLDGREDVAALVLLAAPAAPITESLRFQAEKMAELLSGLGDQAVVDLHRLTDDVQAIADGDLEGPDVGGASRLFWSSWIDAAQAAPDQVAAADLPTLALGGEYDWNVPPEHVRAWEQHLPDDGEIQILPNITHALTYLGTDEVAAIGLDDLGTEVDASVVEALASWLGQALELP